MNSTTTSVIRIYLLDDHMLFREGLRRLLDSDERFLIVGQSGDSAGALAELSKTAVDVLVLDYDLGKENALTLLEPLRAMSFSGKILVVTAGLPDKDALALIKAGISGIFHKQESPEELQRAIVEVAQGR